jgi:hypothetical protein
VLNNLGESPQSVQLTLPGGNVSWTNLLDAQIFGGGASRLDLTLQPFQCLWLLA